MVSINDKIAQSVDFINAETWLMHMWLTGTEDRQHYQILQRALHAGRTVHEQADRLAEYMRVPHETAIPNDDVMSSILKVAFSRVNWVEVIVKSRQ
jgi:hypothetical protein